jgi:hypothetical protein
VFVVRTVERAFGVLKPRYGLAKARYFGIARNRTRFELMCVALQYQTGFIATTGDLHLNKGNYGR